MSTKMVYFYKVELHDTTNNTELQINQLKQLLKNVFDSNMQNNAIFLTRRDDTEPMVLDILEDTDEYLFARLNRKRLNNSLQIRQYSDLSTNDVLPPDEIDDKGVELFTYCIYGYKHGILSVAKSNGAPDGKALTRIFQLYDNRYYLDLINVPNQDLIERLINGNSPEINRISIDVPTPDAQILESIFKWNDHEIIDTIRRNTFSLVFDVKPQSHGALNQDPNLIQRMIEAFRTNRQQYKKVVLSGKPDSATRQMNYDLFEEYFKYQISVPEFHQEDGRKVENDKEVVKAKYRLEMMNVYNEYKISILAVCNR